MELTVNYVVSQIFTIIMYALLSLTYYLKDRKSILIVSFLSMIANGIAYFLLHAWSGLLMCIIAVVRNIVFIIDENKNGKKDKMAKLDIVVLILVYIACIISAVFTYEGVLSLLSVFATMVYTYSVCQKDTKIYKLLGIPVGILWVIYNAYVKSIFGIILEGILLICSISGYIIEKKNIKRKED